MAPPQRRKSVLVSAQQLDDHVNILIAGEMNSGTSPKVESELRAIVKNSDGRLVASLENVSLVTSAGLRVFLLLAREIEGMGGKIAFYDAPQNVLHVFRMTGFDTILLIEASYSDALQRVESATRHPTNQAHVDQI